MENTLVIVSIIGGIIGTITGVLGLTFTVISNKRHAQEKAEERERHAQERAEEKERHAQEHAEKKERHAHGLKMYAQEKARTERLMFLADRIFDPYIPKEFKLPFYEEYISMKGNGTAVRFWLLESEREKKAQQSA